MTTIAWDGRYLAADGRITSGNDVIMTDSSNKIFIVKDIIIAVCGSTADEEKLIQCILSGENSTKEDLQANAIFIEKGKAFTCGTDKDGKYWQCSTDDFVNSMGSGQDFALAGMDTGMNAMDAVKLAIKRDVFSGGVITFFDTKNSKAIVHTLYD